MGNKIMLEAEDGVIAIAKALNIDEALLITILEDGINLNAGHLNITEAETVLDELKATFDGY